MDKREQARLRKQKQRDREGGNSVTLGERDINCVTQYHPVMEWLIPGEKRKKMELIVESLTKHNQLENVYLGAGVHSLPLDIVGEMLEVTR